ncbi:DUF1761 domain-containing protein [Marivita sp. XM-24bin2]|jgi:hypothetical protein|uniref:DUF1761 domain-containing protein n=1 Tax=unclassified Marivita TaxID=2632480 RepID=UPI000D7B4BC4|nr:DUF1761 domain-containing protein [Marivita sp. XM-24bin2]MCR9110153.1 DUF1761 domain-containing protein [Paracoccaceae bacterium]PWL34335.1 MAG: DUF1761 domain-containing protein [Marivita sp. XM-24bin2]
MPILPIIAAGLAGWAFGAVWYSIFSKPWMTASGVATDDTGRPAKQKSPLPYVISLVSAMIVAATMYYAFDMLNIVTIGKGFTSGLGIGACFAAPWLATTYGFAGRPFKLTLIDGGYATFGSAVIGAVIPLF